MCSSLMYVLKITGYIKFVDCQTRSGIIQAHGVKVYLTDIEGGETCLLELFAALKTASFEIVLVQV